jgi:hypothetical protein
MRAVVSRQPNIFMKGVCEICACKSPGLHMPPKTHNVPFQSRVVK